MRRLFQLCLAVTLAFSAAPDLNAQGCGGQGTPGLSTGRTSVRSGFESTITGCGSSTGPNILIFGGTQGPVLFVPEPIACVTGCFLACPLDIVVPLAGNTFTFFPPRVGRPRTVCVQCIAVDLSNSCITLTNVLNLTVLPPV